jgi:hypothetical protein
VAVGFEPEKHGSVSVGTNGPSGAGLVKKALSPLGLVSEQLAFTDAVPWFFIKGGPKSQGEAISGRFAPIAERIGKHAGSLPARPTPSKLVAIAASDERRESLRAEITEAGAPLVISLGQEALDAVRAVADGCEGVQTQLAAEGYGARGRLQIGTLTLDFLPLVHPGFERLTVQADWLAALRRWRENLGNG